MIRTKTKTVTKLFSIKNVIIALAAISLLTVTTFIVSGTETQEFVFGSFAKQKSSTNTTKKTTNPSKASKPAELDCGSKKVAVCNKQGKCSCTSPAKSAEYYGPETKLGERCPDDSPKGKDYRYRDGKKDEDCGYTTGAVTPTLKPGCAVTNGQMTCNGVKVATPEGYYYDKNGQLVPNPTAAATPTIKPGCVVTNGQMTCNGVKVATPEGYYYDKNGQLVPITLPGCIYDTAPKLVGGSPCLVAGGDVWQQCPSVDYLISNGKCVKKSTANCPPTGRSCTNNKSMQIPGQSFECNATDATGKITPYYCCPAGTSSKLINGAYTCATDKVEITVPPTTVPPTTVPPTSTPTKPGVTEEAAKCPPAGSSCSSNGSIIGIQFTCNITDADGTIKDRQFCCPDGRKLEKVGSTTACLIPLSSNVAPLTVMKSGTVEDKLVTMPLGESYNSSGLTSAMQATDYIVVGLTGNSGQTSISSLKLPSQDEVNAKKDAYNKCMWYGVLFFRKAACMAENQLPVVVYYPPEVADQTTCSEYQSTQAAVTVATQAGEQLENVNDLEFLDVKCTIY